MTIRRYVIKRKIEAGKILAKCNYSLTDDYSFDKSNNFGESEWLQTRIQKDVDDFKVGVINFDKEDFKTKSGAAWKNDDGTYTLVIHSNLSYKLKEI